MNTIKLNFLNENEMITQFNHLSNQLFNKYVLIVNGVAYRLVDIEFYAFAETFKDPYTHKHVQQLSNGKFYLHGSGMDITFGDGVNFGGILIRGIIKLKKEENAVHYVPEKYFDGPWLCSSEIIAQLKPITEGSSFNEIRLAQTETESFPFHISAPFHEFHTKRIGLAVKNDQDAEKFRNMPLRHVALLEDKNSFKHKISGISNLTNEAIRAGNLTLEKEEKILGYKRKR